MLPRQMGLAKKIDPMISSIFFEIKVLGNITDNKTDLAATQKLTLNFCSHTSGILQ